MIVTLIGKNCIYKTKLPKDIEGNYWITGDNNKKILGIEGFDGNWKISEKSNMKILKPNSITEINVTRIARDKKNTMESVILEENNFYYIYLEDFSDNMFVLYCSPNYEKKSIKLYMKSSNDILIGSDDEKNDIIYDNPLVKDVQARIFLSNGQLMIENYDENFGTFINNNPVTNVRKLLFNGDVVFIMGLKIIIVGRNIFINDPFHRVSYKKDSFERKNESIELDLEKIENKNEEAVELYSDLDYFSRAPRLNKTIEHEVVKIDPPPENQNREGMPLFLVMGSSLSMGLISVISMISTITNVTSGQSTWGNAFLSLIMSFAMLISMILFPVLNNKYEKRKKKKAEENRQKRYREYIQSKSELLDSIMNKQKKILQEKYLSEEECIETIISKGPELWERKIENNDFLRIRLGIGDLPLDAEIEYPKQDFKMEDDNLREILETISNKSKMIKNVPITYSMAEKNISSAIIKNNPRLKEKFMQSIILQLITLHSYNDLKLVFLLKEDNKKNIEHLKTLPHVWDDEKQIRFWADSFDDMKEITRYLEAELENRRKIQQAEWKNFRPYYVIITDDYKRIENLKFITELLQSKKNLGFSLFCITENLLQLPNECQVFINLENEKGLMFESVASETSEKEFKFDPSLTFFFEKIGAQLSGIPIKQVIESKTALPNSYTFMEMYDVGRIEQLNILQRWNNNDTTKSLQAPIGIDPSGMIITLDIHEKFHGPHGLIAGSTGSGKSELIITYILSLALNYHPDDVNLILIDYKGGGLAGAFQKKDIKLPHLVGVITNIDKVGLQRSLLSIQSELRRRQIIFNEAREKTDGGTIDIYKYQKLYHDGIVNKPVPHLLIICDEFAELKQQQEEFMEELISVARIGRSLGVHLILATQKPAGIVNEQIRSNSKFGICLKVQETEDSMDVIKKPDAANLKKTGQFYMQVGNNEYFTVGQAAWAGAQYIPSDVVKKKLDNSIKFVSSIGQVIKQIEPKTKKTGNTEGEQLTNMVKYMYELANKENIVETPLWMESIPENIFIQDIRKKYKIKNENNEISPVIGEFDDPYNQRQGVVRLDLSNQGNTIIYGNAESGKETLLSTLVYDIMTNYLVDDVQMYLIDFGTEALKIFKNSPHIGDVVLANEEEKLQRLFEMLQKEIRERINIISNYGGDYKLYRKNNKMPMIITIINNYEAFSENYIDKYDELLLTLTRDGIKCGIIFILTASNYNDIRYRMLQNFKQKIALQVNNQDDYLNIYENFGKRILPHIFGRGFVQMEDIYEFQTARICEPEKWNSVIESKIKELNSKFSIKAKEIPTLPDKVDIKMVIDKIVQISNVPLGIDKQTLDVATLDLKKKMINIITGRNIDILAKFTTNLIDVLNKTENVSINLLDCERIIQTEKTNIDMSFKNLELEIENRAKRNKEAVCIIVGIDKFLNNVEDSENRLMQVFNKAKELQNYTFIIVDSVNKIKGQEYNTWYQENLNGNETGIWIGNGVKDQYLLNMDLNDNKVEDNCGSSFGYFINNGKAKMIKLIGMKDEEE